MRGYEFHIKEKNGTLRAGFEPARGDPIGFQVQRLNHSAITAVCVAIVASNSDRKFFLDRN